MKISVVNLKGGVGKTITSVNLAANLGRIAPTVLVDADPQGSAATWAALATDLPCTTIAISDALIGGQLPAATVGYEHVVIDTPPGDTNLVRASSRFSEIPLVPVQPTLQDLNRLRPTLELIDGAGNDPDVLVLLTRVRSGTRSAREARDVLSDLGLRVLDSEIPLLEAYGWGFGAVPPRGSPLRPTDRRTSGITEGFTMTKRTDTTRVLEALRGPTLTPTISEVAPTPIQVTGTRGDQVRFTFDMARRQNRYVKQFVLDCDTTGSAATRALWALVEQDSALAERLRGYLARERERESRS